MLLASVAEREYNRCWKAIVKLMYPFEASKGIKPIIKSPASRAIRLPCKIFQIGFNRCGTRTLHHYFSRNGLRAVHWDEGRLARRMFANLASGNNLLEGYEQFDVFTDMEYLDDFGTYLEAYKLFPQLAAQYPNAIFILNTRNREAWIRSRLTHGKELSHARRAMVHYNVTSIHELMKFSGVLSGSSIIVTLPSSSGTDPRD